jgi:sphinganine-1-phosphate aldolase
MARKLHPEMTEPLEMIVPVTAHPAFVKAAHLFGLRAVLVPVVSRGEKVLYVCMCVE